MNFATRAIHVGQEADPSTGATITPIFQTSTYTQEGLGENKGYEYSRTGNPTRTALEACLAALENAQYGLAFSSGMAATSAHPQPVAARRSCARRRRSLRRHVSHLRDACCARRASTSAMSPRATLAAYAAADPARDEARLDRDADQSAAARWWISPPSRSCATRTARALVVDNTFASPYLQQPLDLGADIVVHSTTKYISGHSDVVGGAVLTSDDELYEPIKFYQNAAGGVPAPFDAWLTLRGVKTLAVRMRQHCENARGSPSFLAAQPEVEQVYYPGLAVASRPRAGQAADARLRRHGLVRLRGRRARTCDTFVRDLQLFALAESLGGVESLCSPSGAA